MVQVLGVPAGHALNRLSEPLKQRIVAAQSDGLETEFRSAYELCARALSDLKIAIKPPRSATGRPASDLGDKPAKELVSFYSGILARGGVPEQALSLQAANLTHRTQLLRAFLDPDRVIAETCGKVVEVVGTFPQTADDIRRGRNPGDVLDPYILGAAQA
jgi:hypothetical protein